MSKGHLIEPELTNYGDHWTAEIDYMSQGRSADEARARFFDGWRDTFDERSANEFYTADGNAQRVAAFNERFNRELALSARVCGIIERHGGLPHPYTTDDQYNKLCDIIEAFEARNA